MSVFTVESHIGIQFVMKAVAFISLSEMEARGKREKGNMTFEHIALNQTNGRNGREKSYFRHL